MYTYPIAVAPRLRLQVGGHNQVFPRYPSCLSRHLTMRTTEIISVARTRKDPGWLGSSGTSTLRAPVQKPPETRAGWPPQTPPGLSKMDVHNIFESKSGGGHVSLAPRLQQSSCRKRKCNMWCFVCMYLSKINKIYLLFGSVLAASTD